MDQHTDSLSDSSSSRAGPRSGRLAQWFGYLLAVAGLIWVFHDIRLAELPAQMTSIHWGWVGVALVCDVLTYLCQGWRWQLLLEPVGELSAWRTTQAVYAGLFTNEVLPMRFGELVRAYLASRWLAADFMAVIPSMVVERLLDGVWLAVGIGLTVMFVPLPRNLLEAGDALGAAMLVATALFVYVVVRKEKQLEAGTAANAPGRQSWLKLFVARLAKGLREIGLARAFGLAGGLSLAMMVLQALAFWLILWAYGLKVSFWIGAAVYLIVHLGTALPNAPANVGTYQFFTVVALTLFGVDKTTAAGFSVVVFILLTLPLWILGSIALSRSGRTLYSLRAEINQRLARGSARPDGF